MSSLNERKRKGCGQTNDDTKEDSTKRNKKVKPRKTQEDAVGQAACENDNSDSNETLGQEIDTHNQDLNSTSSDEDEEESCDSEADKNGSSCVNVNLNDTIENNMDNIKNDNALDKPEMKFDAQQNDARQESESNNHDHIDKYEQIQTSLEKNDAPVSEENSLLAKDCNAGSSSEQLADTLSIQQTSPSKNCDTEKSNNFDERFDTGTRQEEASENVNLINTQAQAMSTPASGADGCVSSLKLNNHPISNCDTSNVGAIPTMQAENLSHPGNAEQQSSSAPSIWQNVHQYTNTTVDTTQCFKAADISDTQVSESRGPDDNEFQQEYNRIQNEDMISKMKTEGDHIAAPDNQQQQLLNQHVFERTHNPNADYRNMVHTQPEVPYGNMFNEMAQRPQQQQQQPHQYSHEQQFYQMRLQQQQHASLLNQHQPNLNLQDALQDEQLLAYLHHQQQQSNHRPQQHDAYADLVMDEFHDDGNVNASANLYKLQLSPAAKHENQDDGYETSAGDVLTPNSHSSSTHSGTPNQSLSVSQHVPSTSALAMHNVPQSQQQGQHLLHQPQSHMPAPAPANALIDSFSPAPTHLSEDPYKFHDDASSITEPKSEHTFCVPSDQQMIHNQATVNSNLHQASEIALGKPPQKRRGRKKKIPVVDGMPGSIEMVSADPSGENPLAPPGVVKVKERKKHDRFNGMSEEEVAKRTLPDHLCHNLDIVIVGINPGLFAAYKGHHYAGPGNHFWKCLYLSGLTQEQMSADEDFKLMKYGIGFTNMVQRATKGSADLTRKEIKEGSRILLEKLQTFQPKIAVFNGKLIFEVFSGKKDFHFGRQPDCVEGTNTYVWVMPSSSARCAQLPRAADKVPFYAALKKFRDYLNGLVPQIDEAECVFTEQRIREMCEQEQARNLAARNLTQSQQPNNGAAPGTQQIEQSENSNGGPGPPSMLGDRGGYLGSPANFQSQPEKKKRGRPKKLKIQEIIDPNTGERIQITNQHAGSMNDYSNILNLSMVAGEVPKKKRGRPKKVKILGGSNSGVDSAGHPASTPTHNTQPQHSLFSNSPQNVNVQHMAGYGSPISPSVHGSTAFNNMAMATPPLPLQHHVAERAPSSDIINSNKQQVMDAPSATSPQSSLPPGSPNVCAVDFEPPNGTVEHSSSDHELATALQQQSQRNNSFHQWMPATSQQHFNYTQESHQQQQQQHQQHQYQREQSLGIQMHQQQQGSPHASWPARAHQSFEATNENNQRQQQQQQQQHHHYLMNTSQNEQQRQHALHHQQSIDQQQQQPQQQPQQHQHQQQQQQQQSTDVAAKSLSGLESLVDQIPTIAESEAAAAAAVESRLQALQRESTPSLADLQAESIYEPRVLNEATGHESRNSSSNGGSNTPQHYGTGGGVTANGGGASACSSPTISHNLFNSNNMHRHHSQASSAASSPHAHSQQQQQQQYGSVATNFSDHNSGTDMLAAAAAQTPPSSTVATSSAPSATTSHLFSNFSVSHLAASSCNSNSNSNNSKNVNDWSPNSAGGASGTGSPYHHSNLMAAAAIQLTTSPHHQMYIDHHTSMHPHHAAAHLTHSSPHQHHMQVNSFYPPTAQAHHHHPGMTVAAYGPSATSQHAHHPHVHNAGADYGTYGATAAHMIHMPSPNYPPYGYGTPPPPTGAVATQNNYSSWNHHHHHPSTVPGHHSHHLSMFERLKPSDIGSYTGF